MKFVKLLNKPERHGGTPTTDWRMVIDNLEDLNRFHGLDAVLCAEALISLPESEKTHCSGPDVPVRAAGISQWLGALKMSLKEGEKKHPLIEVAKLVDNKYIAMLGYLEKGNAVTVNHAGGWCGYEGFKQSWDSVVLEEVIKNDLGFPVDSEVLNANTIVLENASKGHAVTDKVVKKHVPDAGTIGTICNLKEVDMSYVKRCIEGCTNVVIESQLTDTNQLAAFMYIFTTMERKNVYLFLPSNAVDTLKNSDMYKDNESKHNIIFCKDLVVSSI